MSVKIFFRQKDAESVRLNDFAKNSQLENFALPDYPVRGEPVLGRSVFGRIAGVQPAGRSLGSKGLRLVRPSINSARRIQKNLFRKPRSYSFWNVPNLRSSC